jgi:hypothetical protein
MYSPKKMGRPTDTPLTVPIQARIDEDSAQILLDFCEENAVTKSEALRIAIRRLMDSPKKEEE